MLACDYGQVEAARVLLELGADAQKVDTSGSNCLLRVCALPNPHKDIITLLVRQAKIDVNSRNPKGCTPLMFAAMQGRVETVECLMNLGADKSLKNANDNTAYMLAESLNNSRVTRWFEEHK
jgi:ankyrin repeat protein